MRELPSVGPGPHVADPADPAETSPARGGPVDLVGDPVRFLREARSRVESHQRGSDGWGSRTTQLYTAAVDNTLRRIYADLVAGGQVSGEWLGEELCVVATGGYARRSLCPSSDVDLVFVCSDPREEALGLAVRTLLYPLWDADLQVGHRSGTTEEILEAAEGDLTARVALLDLRYVGGSRALYERFLRSRDEALEHWGPEILDRVRPENRARFARYGESVFLLEPQVKEGKGGLRDFHWLGWIARLRYGLQGDYDLLLSGLVEPHHYRDLVEAHEFLLRVRIQLHLQAGRAQDRLLFESQEPVARALGFRARGGLLAVEHFMGQYYRHAYKLAHTCGLYAARMLGSYWDEPDPEEEGGSAPLQLGPSAPVVRAPWNAVACSDDERFRLANGAVRCTRPEELGRRPELILELFAFLQQVGGRLHHETTEDVRAVLNRVNKSFRSKPSNSARFRELLEGPRVFSTLVAMHRSGFLGRYIPEFGACFCQAQHNRVHLYTVDVHSLYAVRELEALGSDELKESATPFAEAWARRSTRGPLLLAALLHDMAKAHGAAHSRVGADMALGILQRLGYPERDISRVQWLVRYHLVLSDLAYHRDLHDPKTLETLRAVVPDREHLDDLLALTWADTRATNPTLLTSWKRSLLEQVYQLAIRGLSSGAEAAPDPDSFEVVRSRVEMLLAAEFERKKVSQVLDDLLDSRLVSEGYFHRHPAEVLATHAGLLQQFRKTDGPCVSHVRHLDDRGLSEWIVCARDRPGLFSALAGALAAGGFSITSAEAITRQDGLCIDTFAVVGRQGGLVRDEARWRRVARLTSQVLKGEADLVEAVAAARRTGAPSPNPGALKLRRVSVRNDLSESASVVEVVTPDRVGLVFEITRALVDEGLDLRLAKIATRQDLASDTFYVVGRRGKRLGLRRARQLERMLQERFA